MPTRSPWAAVLAVLLCSSAAQAVPLLELDPADGAIQGPQGSVRGWGFSLRNDENFLVVTGASFETPTALGSFKDFISASNFFVVGPGRDMSTVWTQPFGRAERTGIGRFRVDAGASIGQVARGQIVLSYDLYSRSPYDPLFNPDTDTLSNGNLLSTDASVMVAVPEPATWAMMAGGFAWIAGRRLRTRRPPRPDR